MQIQLAIFPVLTGLALIPRLQAQAWEKPLEKWTEVEARCVLAKSPWTKRVSEMTVRWESAAPVVHARRITNSIPFEEDGGGVYRISIAGFRFDPGKANASLQYCGREPVIMSVAHESRDRDGTLLVVFEFPKKEPVRDPGVFRLLPFGLRIRRNEFHFAAGAGASEIRLTFDLRDMVFLGELAL
jgi:hypothetical protein